MKVIKYASQTIPNEYRDKINRFSEGIKNSPEIQDRIKDNLGMLISTAVYYAKTSSLDISDLLQEGLLYMMRYDGSYRGEKATYTTYMRWSISGAIINFINVNKNTIRNKSKKEENSIQTVELSNDWANYDKTATNEESKRDDDEENKFLIKKLLKRLNAEEQKVITLLYLDGKTQKEAMDELGPTYGIKKLNYIKQLALLKMHSKKKYLEYKEKNRIRINKSRKNKKNME